jgi:hypothetical protein
VRGMWLVFVRVGRPERFCRGLPAPIPEFVTFHVTFIAKFHAWCDARPNADLAAIAPRHSD